MGLRKQIYIPSSETWNSIQSSAKSQGRSVSNYLVNLHKDNLANRAFLGYPDSGLGAPAEHFDPEPHLSEPTVVREDPILMKKIEIPDDFVDPIQKAASDLEDLTEEKITVKDKSIFTGKKPKKNSKQASVCSECRAPAGHRAGCSKSGA